MGAFISYCLETSPSKAKPAIPRRWGKQGAWSGWRIEINRQSQRKESNSSFFQYLPDLWQDGVRPSFLLLQVPMGSIFSAALRTGQLSTQTGRTRMRGCWAGLRAWTATWNVTQGQLAPRAFHCSPGDATGLLNPPLTLSALCWVGTEKKVCYSLHELTC